MKIEYEAIGVIRTPFDTPSDMPKNPNAAADVAGTVELAPQFAAGLQDLEGFSHVFLLVHMHRSAGYELTLKPSGEERHRGVFATRSPRRPNPIGLSVVRLDRVDGNVLEVRGADFVNGTPLLDVKPYMPTIDARPHARSGWLVGPTGGEGGG